MEISQWNKWKSENEGNIDALIKFAEKYNPEWVNENIVYADDILSALVPVLEEHDWKTVVDYLKEISDKPSEKYYGTDDFTGSLIHLSWDETVSNLEEDLIYNNFFD